MSAVLTFPAVTPAQWAALKTEAATAGIDLTGYSGTASAHGCTVAYDYAGHDGCGTAPLTLTLEHAPFMCGGIALGKLHDLVESVLPAPVQPAEKSTS